MKINDKYVKEELKKEAVSFASGSRNTGFALKGFCGQDLSQWDMSDLSLEYFRKMTFDSRTKFPENPNLIPQFVKELIEQGKYESFTDYVTGIIEQGKEFDNIEKTDTIEINGNKINGSGTTIAIIDRFSNISKGQFGGEKITVYRVTEDGIEEAEPNEGGIFLENDNDEEENGLPNGFHGNTVASLAVGKTCGVARNANAILFDIGDMEFQEAQKRIFKFVAEKGSKGEITIPDIISISDNATIDKKILTTLQNLGCDVINSDRFVDYFTWGRINDSNEMVLDEFIEDLLEEIDNMIKKPSDGNSKLERIKNVLKEKKNFIENDTLIPVTGRTSSYIDDEGNEVYKYNGSLCGNSFAICQAAGMFLLARQIDKSISYDEFSEIAKKIARVNSEGRKCADKEEILKVVDERHKTKEEQCNPIMTPQEALTYSENISDFTSQAREDNEERQNDGNNEERDD